MYYIIIYLFYIYYIKVLLVHCLFNIAYSSRTVFWGHPHLFIIYLFTVIYIAHFP